MTSYCVFNVGERRVGIELSYVREIIEHHLVVPTPVPLTPPFVHGLFNLRGQVLPCFDLSTFVGAQEKAAELGPEHRAVVVQRGNLRFAATGRRIDTIEADPSTFAPLENAALHPALDAEASTDYGRFHVIHLDRLEACLSQSLKLTETSAGASVAAVSASANNAAAGASASTGAITNAPASETKPMPAPQNKKQNLPNRR